MTFQYRTVFISDAHLGFAEVRAAELSAFLKHVHCERLYLVGDIIDLQALRQRWRWPAMHNQVVRRILKIAKRGAVVTYVPGNHDDSLRQYVGLDLGGVRLVKQAIHRTADGRMLLITHGDEYDVIVRNSPLLAWMGTWAYDHLIILNRWVNLARALFGRDRWSFAHSLKKRVKSACVFMSNFETALLGEAQRRGMDGVVCGHIHQPALRSSQQGEWTGLYANCGDWVERASALVEHDDGRLELLDIDQLLREHGIQIKRLAEEPVNLDPEQPDAVPALPEEAMI